MLSRIISLYKKVNSEIGRSSSGRSKYYLILSFFAECEKTFHSAPPFSLVKDFVGVLIDVILKSDINFTDPSKLNATKLILNDSRSEFVRTKGGDIILSQINKAIDILNMQMLKSYFYLGKYDDGLVVLNSMLNERDAQQSKEDDNPAEQRKKKDIRRAALNKHALVNPDIFKESRAYEILTEIKNELERLNSYSDEQINILLVEQDGLEVINSNGTIQSLLCTTGKKKTNEDKVVFENITDLEDYSLENTLTDIVSASNQIVKHLSGKTVSQNTKSNLRFQNIKVVYRGASFGLGAAIISACNYFRHTNSRKRFKISNAAAFTGAIDGGGNVLKVNSNSVKNKIEAAFFSWVKYCVVPKENLADAKEAYEGLKALYPTKEMEIISVEYTLEVFEHKELFVTENLSVNNYVKLLTNKYRYTSVALLLLITAGLVFVLASKLLPKDIKPLPNTETDMSLIYAPDRDTNWIFTNNNYLGGDTIDFGDVAIGDQWFPMIEFWNNGRGKEEFNVYINGKDKEEFQLTWLYRNEQPEAPNKINEGTSQTVYTKFVPVKGEGYKNAELVFENKKTLSRKTIFLKGIAKRYSNGYCIDIGKVDDALVLEPNTNLLQDNFTISFWIKPYFIDKEDGIPILRVDNNPLSNNKIGINISGIDSLIDVSIHGSKSTEIPYIKKFTGLKPRFNEWNFIAFTVSDTSAAIILNDKHEKFSIDRNALRKINDCIYFGRLHPSERKSVSKSLQQCKYYLDEFRIFSKVYSPEELIKNRMNSGLEKEVLLAGFSFDDATSRKVFDESTNDFWPRLYGGVKRVIDTQPFNKHTKTEMDNTKGNKVFRRNGKGFAKLNKEVYNTKSSFTLQCDIKVDPRSADFKGDIFPVSKNAIFPSPYFINRPDLDINFDSNYDSAYVRILNHYTNNHYLKHFAFNPTADWNRFTISYDINLNEYNFYINNTLIKTLTLPDIQDITQNYMGISFALANYYGSPRFSSNIGSSIDNIRLFNRPLSANELFSGTSEGLVAFWTFENTDKELAYDEISNLPLLMLDPFEIVNEEVVVKR
jgi:Concanavalin A-like lectin/glucanases superfamily